VFISIDMLCQVLLTLAMICTSVALHLSSPLDGVDSSFMKCTNMTGEERKICRSEYMEEIQLKILLARAYSEDNRFQFEKFRWRVESKHNLRKAALAERRENITLEHVLQKDAAADRSLVFPGLTVDPYDAKSVMIAFITLASFLAFSILNCCKHNSRQPMLIVNTFIFIVFTILNVLVLVDTSKWIIWLPVSFVVLILGAVLPIHFISDGRGSFCAVLNNSDMEKTLNTYLVCILVVEAIVVMLRFVLLSFSPRPELWIAVVVVLVISVLFYSWGFRLQGSIRRAVRSGASGKRGLRSRAVDVTTDDDACPPLSAPGARAADQIASSKTITAASTRDSDEFRSHDLIACDSWNSSVLALIA
jgi:hypothetical protein